MTTETAPCVLARRQQETRIVEAIAQFAEQRNLYVPFYLIQARTGIAPCELGPILGRLIEGGTLRTSALGGYALAACPHDAAFGAMETARCAYCGCEWP